MIERLDLLQILVQLHIIIMYYDTAVTAFYLFFFQLENVINYNKSFYSNVLHAIFYNIWHHFDITFVGIVGIRQLSDCTIR